MKNEEKLERTPLYASHQALKARIVPFAGYEMPVQYSGVLEETKTVRAASGLFDVSHMGQFSVKGKSPLQAVQTLVTNDLSRIKLGQAQYNMLCNENGGVIDDLIVYHRSEAETYICVNASNRKKDYEWMRSRLPPTIELTDESDETALIAVQGPKAEALMCELSDSALVQSLKYYWAADAKVLGHSCYLSRTGYTGEDGFEIYIKNDKATQVWETLLDLGKKYGTLPIGLGARDTLRLEMGYPLHGHELSETISPLEAGLGWVVKPEITADFVGKKSLQTQLAEGLKRRLHGFLVKDKRIARQGYPIVTEKRDSVGEITSGTFSPHLGCPIAMGFVMESKKAEKLFALVRNDLVPMELAPLPFVPSHTKKNARTK